jgi:hypothetical protein
MTHQDEAGIRIRYEERLLQARWGALFHVFRLEQSGVVLDWRPSGFPTRERSLLEGADVGLFLEPAPKPGLGALTLEASPMMVLVAAGHRLADYGDLRVADILDRPFPGAPSLHPEWTAFWRLDQQRGAPPATTDDDVRTAAHGLEVVAEAERSPRSRRALPAAWRTPA